MFKFIKKYAETIQGVDIYPIIALLVFFIFFLVLLILVKKMDKATSNHLAHIPLENEIVNPSNQDHAIA